MWLNPRRVKYADYFDWRSGVLNSLFSEVAADNINGLAIVPPAKISTEFDYFGAVSRFFGDAMLSDIPSMDSGQTNLLTKLTEHWSVTGECLILETQLGRRAIRPDYVHPVFDEYDSDIIRKFVFVFPQKELATDNMFFQRLSYATKARVIEYDVETGLATVAIRDYSGTQIADTPKGDYVDIGRVIWINTQDGVYYQMRGIVREIIVRLNILQRYLNSVSNSILQIDTDAISGGALEYGVSQDKVNTQMNKGLGLTVEPPFSGEAEPRYIERQGTGLTESIEYLRMLLGQLGVITGVPDYVFGVQLGLPAAETGRVLFAGQAKVNRFRRAIEMAYAEMGTPIKFATEPFVTHKEKIDALLKEYEKGVISQDEIRTLRGYGAVKAGMRFVSKIKGVLDI